jgi:hypothetical protein
MEKNRQMVLQEFMNLVLEETKKETKKETADSMPGWRLL